MTWKLRRQQVLVVAAVLATSIFGAVETSALPPHERTGWMAGISYGFGAANITGTGGFDKGWRGGVTPQFRFGRVAVKQRLLVSFDVKQWTTEAGALPETPSGPEAEFTKFQVNSQIFALGLTGYPGKPQSAWGGLNLSAGVGPAVTRLDFAMAPITGTGGEDPPETVSYQWGWGFFLGAGYELRVLPFLGAGVAVNYIYSSIDGSLVADSRVWPVNMALNWYF